MPVEIIDMRLLQQMQATRHPDPDAVWDVLAVLDQNYRRGRLDAAQFKRLKARVERHALGAASPGAAADSTSDLCTIIPPSAAATANAQPPKPTTPAMPAANVPLGHAFAATRPREDRRSDKNGTAVFEPPQAGPQGEGP
jgi:hypothetical protein